MVEPKKIEAPKKETGITCPHCQKFIPDPVKNTLKTKVSWYLDGKDPKKGAKPFKVVRYPETPAIGQHLQFRDAMYEVVRLVDTNAGECAGYVKLIKAGSEKPIHTQIQDKEPEVIDKTA